MLIKWGGVLKDDKNGYEKVCFVLFDFKFFELKIEIRWECLLLSKK